MALMASGVREAVCHSVGEQLALYVSVDERRRKEAAAGDARAGLRRLAAAAAAQLALANWRRSVRFCRPERRREADSHAAVLFRDRPAVYVTPAEGLRLADAGR